MSSSPSSTSDIGINHLQYGLTWTLTGLAIIAVAARCQLKLKFKLPIIIEDYLMILALALQISYQTGFTLMCNWGSGRPMSTLTAEQMFNINKWSWTFTVPGFLVSIIARISIAILLVRIFGRVRWFKMYMTYFTTIQSIVGVVSIIFLVAQCDPYEGLWNTAVIRRYWDKRIYQYTALTLQFFFVISDITYALFPVMIIWKLNMPKRRKLGLLVVMAMSLVTMCAALAKITVSLIPMTNPKVVANTAVQYFASITSRINFCSDCEQALVIIMGCIPTLHLASRLRLPSLTKLRGSVSKVFNWSDRIKSSRGKKSAQTDSAKSSFPDSQKGLTGYQGFHLVPQVQPSDDGSFESTRKVLYPQDQTYATSEGALPQWDGNSHYTQIVRTDRYPVSYNVYMPPEVLHIVYMPVEAPQNVYMPVEVSHNVHKLAEVSYNVYRPVEEV